MSDNEYTPTTGMIRDRHSQYVSEAGGVADREAKRDADFDRWLAAHDAQVREEGATAMREAAAATLSAHNWGTHGHDQTPSDLVRALPIPSTGAEEWAWQNDCGEIRRTSGEAGSRDLAARFNGTPMVRKDGEFVEAPPRHNHVTRDIKQPGICPACDWNKP